MMRYLTVQLFESFILKKDKLLQKGGDLRSLNHKASTKEFEATVPIILENVLVEFVKQTFIEFAAESMMVPWIYLCFNKEISPPSQTPGVQRGDSTAATGLGESAIDKSKKQSHSLNSSRMGGGYHMGLGTSINKSGAGLLAQSGIDPNQFNNSGLHESQMDVEMEYGYATDEDSIFHSFE